MTADAPNAPNAHDTPATDLLAAGAGPCARALAGRRLSALELCDAAIDRIERLDGAINAVVVRDFERARVQARAADAALARGERRPLLGVPMTVKESFNVEGLTTCWGVPPFRDFRPATDALAVQRLKAAGAIILGKTNVPMALADWQTVNPVYGLTVNPHDHARSPGGSSGGAAAALAAGMVALELGSDIGGSIRVPAHLCGVYGHKPSHGLLPTHGHDFPRAQPAPDVLSVIGPLAHNPDDLELALNLLAVPDTAEGTGYRLALPAPRQTSPRGLRVLLLLEHPVAAASAEVRAAVEQAAATLEQGGATVTRGSALLPDLTDLHTVYGGLLMTIMTRGAPGAVSPLTAHEWLALLDRRHRIQQQWRALFDTFDVVLCPPFGCAAFEHVTEPDFNARRLSIDGADTAYGAQSAWAGMATLAGLPATVAPVGHNAGGLPLGVQIMGPYLEDRTTIAVARMLATQFNPHA